MPNPVYVTLLSYIIYILDHIVRRAFVFIPRNEIPHSLFIYKYKQTVPKQKFILLRFHWELCNFTLLPLTTNEKKRTTTIIWKHAYFLHFIYV